MDKRLHTSQSIRKRQTFQIIHNRGKFARGKFLNLWVYTGPEVSADANERPKIGIVVSRKVSLRANVRNLWKRRIREAFRNGQEAIRLGIAILVQAKGQGEAPSYQSLVEELETLLKKTEALK